MQRTVPYCTQYIYFILQYAYCSLHVLVHAFMHISAYWKITFCAQYIHISVHFWQVYTCTLCILKNCIMCAQCIYFYAAVYILSTAHFGKCIHAHFCIRKNYLLCTVYLLYTAVYILFAAYFGKYMHISLYNYWKCVCCAQYIYFILQCTYCSLHNLANACMHISAY